jgi:hypothetical protein
LSGRYFFLLVGVSCSSAFGCSEDDAKRFEVRYRSGIPRPSSGGANSGGRTIVDASAERDGLAESGGGRSGTGGTIGTGGTGGNGTGGRGTGGVIGSGDAGPCGCGNIAPLVPCCTTTGACGFVVGAVCLALYRDGGSGGRGAGGAAADGAVDAAPDREGGPLDASSDGKVGDASSD